MSGTGRRVAVSLLCTPLVVYTPLHVWHGVGVLLLLFYFFAVYSTRVYPSSCLARGRLVAVSFAVHSILVYPASSNTRETPHAAVLFA